MHYELDQGVGPRLGMIVLSTDESLEYETRQILSGRAVNLMHTRIFSDPTVTPTSLKDMEARMPRSAELLPGGLAAIAYGCTSASVLIGPDGVERAIQTVQPGVPVTNPISAVLAGLEALGARRIALVTPYAATVAAPMRRFIEAAGVEVVREAGFGEADDRRVARISEASTLDAIRQVAQGGGIDAVFSSCTNLRSFGIIDAAEAAAGIPVLSSNQALVWHLLRLAGVAAPGWGPGQLFAQEGGHG